MQNRIWFLFRIFVCRWKIGKNDNNSEADMSSLVHVDNKNKDILILGEEQAQGLDDN